MDIKATDINQQLQILSDRNIVLSGNSRDILLQYGYYNLINGYKDAFLDMEESVKHHSDYYKDGTTLNQIVALYRFDDSLRRNLLSCITIIETQMKSLISLHFSLTYGTNHWSYLTPNSFTKDQKQTRHVNHLISTLNKNINKFSTKKPHPAICHFVKKYNQIPLWVLNTIMSFGTMSNFYDLLQDDLKKKIAHGINKDMNPSTLTSILYYLTDIRNKCAHNNRLYTHKIDQRATRIATIPQLRIHQKLGIPISAPGAIYQHGQDDILAALLCIVVFFGQNHVYQINYDSIDHSLTALSKAISPDVEDYVRNTTGLLHSYLMILKNMH